MHTCKMIERLLFEEKKLIFIAYYSPTKKYLDKQRQHDLERFVKFKKCLIMIKIFIVVHTWMRRENLLRK